MTMNTLGLGAAVRPAARVSAKKASFTGAPVVGKSSFAVRKTVAPKAGRVVAMAGNAEPIMEAPFKGIMDDLAARRPLYIDDFKQGISTKSLVRVPIFLSNHPFAALLETNQRDRAIAELRAIPRARAKNSARHPSSSVEGLAIRRPVLRDPRPRATRATTTRARRASFRFFQTSCHVDLAGLYTVVFSLNETRRSSNVLHQPAGRAVYLRTRRRPKPTRAATRRPTRRLTVPFLHLRSFRRVVGVRLLPVLRRARPRDRVRRGAHVGDGGHARRD